MTGWISVENGRRSRAPRIRSTATVGSEPGSKATDKPCRTEPYITDVGLRCIS